MSTDPSSSSTDPFEPDEVPEVPNPADKLLPPIEAPFDSLGLPPTPKAQSDDLMVPADFVHRPGPATEVTSDELFSDDPPPAGLISDPAKSVSLPSEMSAQELLVDDPDEPSPHLPATAIAAAAAVASAGIAAAQSSRAPDSSAKPESSDDKKSKGDWSAVKSSESDDKTNPDQKSKKKKKWTWRRRLVTLVVALLAFAVIFRVALGIAFPIVLSKVANSYGLNATYERFSLSLTGGDVLLGRLAFVPQGGTEPFASANYVRATISPLKLFIGKLEVWRVDADGVELNIDRDKSGKMPVIDRLLASAQPTPVAAAKPADAKSAGASQIDLTSPLAIDGFRLQHLRTHIRDQSLTPPLDTMIQLDVRVDDIGSSNRPTTFAVNVYSDQILDALIVEGEARSAGAYLDANVTAWVKGLHLKPLAGYLAPFGVRPTADAIAMAAQGRVRTTAAGLTQAAGQLASAAAAATRSATSPALSVAPATLPAGPTVPADAKPADALAISVDFHKMAVWTDGTEAAALDSFKLDVSKLNTSTLNITSLILDGIRASAERTEEGNLRAAGIELFPVAAVSSSSATTKTTAAASPATAATKPAAPGSAFIASLETLAVKNLLVSVEDRFVIPTSKLGFAVDEFTVKDILLDPAKPDSAVKIAGAFRAPGIARAVRLDGTATPFAVKKAVELKFAADGIVPTAIQPYLDLFGLQSELKDASFTATLSASATIDEATGKVGANARFNKITFRDKEELFGLEDVNFAGVSLDPKTGLLKVDAIEVTGPTLNFRREGDGSFAALGFRTKKPVEGRKREVPPTEPSEVKLARVELGKFVWKGIKVGFEDLKASPPETVTLGDAGLEITDFKFDLENKGPPPAPGKIRGWLVAPKIADRLEMNGSILPTTGSIGLDLTFTGQGITAAGVAGYLKDAGIEPLLKDGNFTAHLIALIGQTPAGQVQASLALDGVKYADGATELGGVDLLKIDGVLLDPKANTLNVGSISIEKPRAHVLRETAKSFVAGGVRIRLPEADQPTGTASTPAAPAPAIATVPMNPVAPGSATQPAVAAGAPVAQPVAEKADKKSPPFVVTLDALKIKDSSLNWKDQATTRPVETTLHGDVSLNKLVLNRESGPADLSISVKIDDVLDSSTVTGTLSANPDAMKFGVSLAVNATGVRGTALEPYLPPTIQLKLKDGRFASKLDASLSPADAGGFQAKLAVNGVDWKDGETGPDLFKLENFRVIVSRLDAPGGVIAIDEVYVGGVELDASKHADGSFRALGIALVPPPSESPEASPATQPTTLPATAPAIATNPATSPAAPSNSASVVNAPVAAPVDARALVAAARKTLPLITLSRLDLNLKRFGFSDLSTPNAQPLTVSDLRFRSLSGIELLGKDPASNPPVRLVLTGRVDPLIRSIYVSTTAAPFAQQPTLVSDVSLVGINGDGLFALMPKLREQIDAARLKDGQFKTHAEVALKVDRRGPADIDFLKGFEADVLVKGTEYRAEPKGQVLLGLDEARVDQAKFLPKAKLVRIKAIELSKPVGFVTREKDGIHAVGLVIKESASPATQPSTAPSGPASKPTTTPATPTIKPASQPVPAKPASTQPIVVQKPDFEIRLDKFVVSGIDFRLEDNSVDPPLIVPLTQLDVQARDISSLAQFEDKPITFSLLAGAGKVPLEKKPKGGLLGGAGEGIGGLVSDGGGLASGGANLLGGGANLLGGGLGALTGGAVKVPEVPKAPEPAKPATAPAPEMENRDLFAQVVASGKIGLYPKPNGWTKLGVAGFELQSLKGEAMLYGITLSHGTFDLTADIRPRVNGNIDVKAQPALVDLSVKDSPQGGIAKFLGLSGGMGLDVLIGALESADKSIAFPLDLTAKPTPEGKVDLDGIGSSIGASMTRIAAKALASAPAKALNMIPGVGGLFAPKPPPEPVVLNFPAGATGLESAEAQKLNVLLEALRSDPEFEVTVKSDLGGGDITLAEQRANPPAEDADAIASTLHRRKLELTRLRADAAADARFRLAGGAAADAVAAVSCLRALDRDLARTEDALDRVYDLLRPGADRQSPRRTRSAGLEIAKERQSIVREIMAGANLPDFATRVKVTAPQFTPSEAPTGGTVTLTTQRVAKH